MSLLSCPKCGKQNNYWHIYWVINRSHCFEGCSIECEHCQKKMKLPTTKTSVKMKFITGFLWMLPALILIGLVRMGYLNFLVAI
ncbi:MAG: hypothetical protein H6767_09480 [Candidatus Peribacteria bacterium]|nr:MAG: hypothetical protein H6767_09480 [Candidatus Peribacteria bacterium]